MGTEVHTLRKLSQLENTDLEASYKGFITAKRQLLVWFWQQGCPEEQRQSYLPNYNT